MSNRLLLNTFQVILIFCSFLCFSTKAFSQAYISIANSPVAKFLLKKENKDIVSAKTIMDAVWYQRISAETVNKNYFTELRKQLNQAQEKKHAASLARGILVHQAIELPVMTFGFFVANGAINFISLWDSSGGNPLKFEEQLMAQTDPITHLSFYAFMLANGFWFDYRSKDMSPEVRQMNFRRLTYEGLAWGSLASSLVADIGTTIKTCAAPPKDDSEKAKNEVDSACHDALNKMLSTAKGQQYISQILTILSIQKITDWVHAGLQKVALAPTERYAQGRFVEVLADKGMKNRFYAQSARLVITANPGWFAVKSVSIVGMLTNLLLFVGVDHILNVPFTRVFTNILRPPLFMEANKTALECYLSWGDKHHWNQQLMAYNDADCEHYSSLKWDLNWKLNFMSSDQEKLKSHPSLKFEESFVKEIDSYASTMQDWRMHLNSDVENALQSWLRMTQRILNQVSVTEKYYEKFVTSMNHALTVRYDVNRPEGDPKKRSPIAIRNFDDFPFRDLPLWGINFEPWWGDSEKVKKGSGSEGEDSVKLTKETAPLFFPKKTTEAQSKFLAKYAKEFLETGIKSLDPKIRPNEIEEFSAMLQILQVTEPNKQMKAIIDFKEKFLGQATIVYTKEYRKFIYQWLREAGAIDPKVIPGEAFNAAFELAYKTEVNQADFDLSEIRMPKWDKIKFPTLSSPTQYLMMSILCGDQRSSIESYTLNLALPDYRPPSFLLQNSQPREICDPVSGTVDGEKFYGIKLSHPKDSQKNYYGVVNYIASNYNSSVVGDITKDGEGMKFKDWFKTAATPSVREKLKNWDKEYVYFVKKYDENLTKKMDESRFKFYQEMYKSVTSDLSEWVARNFKNASDFMRIPKVAKFLGDDIVSSFKVERDFYLSLIQSLRNDLTINHRTGFFYSYLDDVKALHYNEKTTLVKPYTAEFQAVRSTFDEMLNVLVMLPTEINYKDDFVKKRNAYHETLKNLLTKEARRQAFNSYLFLTKNSGFYVDDITKEKSERPKELEFTKEISTAKAIFQIENYNFEIELQKLAKLLEFNSYDEMIKTLKSSSGADAKTMDEAKLTRQTLGQLINILKSKRNKNNLENFKVIQAVEQFLISFNVKAIEAVEARIKTIEKQKFEDLLVSYSKIINLSLRERMALKCVQQLIALESEVTKGVRFKVLMTQGLSFNDADLKSLNSSAQSNNCAAGRKVDGSCR